MTNSTARWCGLLLGLIVSPGLTPAQVPDQIPSPDPELERRTFRVPDGFEVTLFAGDPQLAKPIQMNFDRDGRLWIATSEVYPHIEPGKPARDKVIVLEDTNGDGVADEHTVFADGLLIPTGVLPGNDGAWVANSTELLHFRDTDGDLKADRKEIVLSGFGTEDTHHILHTLRWGPEGHIYFNQSIYIHSHIETPWGVRRLNAGGIWQFRPETRELGVFVRGLVNPWGHEIDRFGQSFMTDGAGGEGINYAVPGAYYLTAANAPKLLRGLNPGSPKHCGLEIVETPALPPEWQGSVITNDFRGHRVCRFELTEDRSGYQSREHQEIIASDHVAFRPIDVRIGPDGAIYIADWYNPIIQHGEVDFRDDRRDHTHGRIWRVHWTGNSSPRVHSPRELTNADLLQRLQSDNRWERQTARRELQERGTAVVPDLDHWLQSIPVNASTEHLRLEALWCFQSQREIRPDLLRQLLAAEDGRVRAAAVRVLSHWKYQLDDAPQQLQQAVQDAHPRVRLEAVRALSFSPLEDSEQQQAALTAEQHPEATARLEQIRSTPDRILTATQVLDQEMDRFLDYGLFLTARELQSSWLPAFQQNQISFGDKVRHLLAAFSAIGQSPPIDVLLQQMDQDSVSESDRNLLVTLIGRSANAEQMSQLVRTAAADRDAALLTRLLDQTFERGLQNIDTGWTPTALQSDDPRLQSVALRAIGQWQADESAAQLTAIVSDPDAARSTKLAALQGIRYSGNAELHATLETVAGNESETAEVRRTAAAWLLSVDPPAGAAAAAMLLQSLPAEQQASHLTRTFLASQNGPQLLTQQLATRKIPEQTAREILQIVRESGRPLPQLEAAVLAAGGVRSRADMTAADSARILQLAAGDASAARGEQIFRDAKSACLKCHAIGGAGGKVGPDLLSLGASAQPDYLLQSLLRPNDKVKENYHTVVVVTLEGKVVSGVQVQQSETELVLRSAENELIHIPVDQIDERSNGVSLMPAGLVDSLTDQDLAGLVRFLSELGRTPEYTLSRQRHLRTWSVLQPTHEARHVLIRSRMGTAAQQRDEFTWRPAWAQVDGTLPLSDIPLVVPARGSQPPVGFAFARSQLQVETAGQLTLSVNDVAGLELLVNERPIPIQPQVTVDVMPGRLDVVLVVDTAKRQTPVQMTVVDDHTSAVVTPINE